ncbi:unnamed protein product [Discosporangium mesarthrocarpum]
MVLVYAGEPLLNVCSAGCRDIPSLPALLPSPHVAYTCALRPTLNLTLAGFIHQGMHMLVAEFLNLVTGGHKRTGIFWRDEVTVGVCQRFGPVSLTPHERAGLRAHCCAKPSTLKKILIGLVQSTGVRFTEQVNSKLRDSPNVKGFKFKMSDIGNIEAVITHMRIVA